MAKGDSPVEYFENGETLLTESDDSMFQITHKTKGFLCIQTVIFRGVKAGPGALWTVSYEWSTASGKGRSAAGVHEAATPVKDLVSFYRAVCVKKYEVQHQS